MFSLAIEARSRRCCGGSAWLERWFDLTWTTSGRRRAIAEGESSECEKAGGRRKRRLDGRRGEEDGMKQRPRHDMTRLGAANHPTARAGTASVVPCLLSCQNAKHLFTVQR